MSVEQLLKIYWHVSFQGLKVKFRICRSIHSFINQWLYSPLLGPGLFFSFVIFFTQTVGLLRREFSPSKGRYLRSTTQTQNKRTHRHPYLEWSNYLSIYLSISLSIYGSTALCWTLAVFSFSWFFTQSVGLLGRGISPSHGCYLHTEQHKHNKCTHRHPCLEWDSKPRSQLSSERRQFIP
jgi:hypothetical protein